MWQHLHNTFFLKFLFLKRLFSKHLDENDQSSSFFEENFFCLKICFTDNFCYQCLVFWSVFSVSNSRCKINEIYCFVRQHPQNTHYLFVKILKVLFVCSLFCVVLNSSIFCNILEIYFRKLLEYLMRKNYLMGLLISINCNQLPRPVLTRTL